MKDFMIRTRLVTEHATREGAKPSLDKKNEALAGLRECRDTDLGAASSKRVCMLAYTFYESDPRVMRYAEALAERGDEVDVIALRRETRGPSDRIHGVRVFRIQKRVLNEKRKLSYLFRILLFFLRSLIFLGRKHLQKRYDVVHVHSVPDFLVFAALLPKLTGAKVILDIHDLLPELYASKFKTREDSLTFRLLLGVERASTAFADHVLIANHLWQEKLLSRCLQDGKCTVVLNVPDRTIFARRERPKQNDEFIVMFPGTLNWHQGVDIAIRAFRHVKDQIANAEFHIYGEGASKEALVRLIQELGLEGCVILRDPLPLREIASVMANADLAVVPKRKDSFGNEAFSTKILEFMALGVPLIVADTDIDRFYFDDSVVKFFHSGDEKDLARCMLQVIRDSELRKRLVRNALEFIERNDWATKKGEYLDLVDCLAGRGVRQGS